MNLLLSVSLMSSILSYGKTIEINNDYINNIVNNFSMGMAENKLDTFDSKIIKQVSVVYNADKEEYDYCVNVDNGYLLFDDNSHIKGYNINKSIDNLDRYFYVYSEKNFYKTNPFTFEIIYDNFVQERDLEEPGYIAQYYNNVIYYNQLDSYIQSKYSDMDLTLYEYNKLSYLSQNAADSSGYLQYSDAMYLKYDSLRGVYYTEGNCGITSISNILQLYKKSGDYDNFPNTNSIDNVNVYADSAYNTYIDNGYFPISSTRMVHTIYNYVRFYAIQAGFVIDMDDNKTSFAYNSTCEAMSYDSTFIPDWNYTYSSIKSEINNDRPFQFRTSNDVHYQGHGMAATGYRKYVGEFEIWNLTYIDIEVVFISVFDGHNQNEVWIDDTTISFVPFEYYRGYNTSIAKCHINGIID